MEEKNVRSASQGGGKNVYFLENEILINRDSRSNHINAVSWQNSPSMELEIVQS